jgi:RNA polymerase sigma factor (sigma-70 family)
MASSIHPAIAAGYYPPTVEHAWCAEILISIEDLVNGRNRSTATVIIIRGPPIFQVRFSANGAFCLRDVLSGSFMNFLRRTRVESIMISAHHAAMNEGDDETARADAFTRQAAAMRSPLLVYFRRRVRDASDVEDLVQEVFLRLTVRGTPDRLDGANGYIFQTAASVLADRHRRRTVRHADDHIMLDPDEHGEADFDPHRIAVGKQALHAAAAALLTMPERTRVIFLLKRLDGLRHQEIATRLGISVSAIEKHVVRAMEHLMAYAGDER